VALVPVWADTMKGSRDDCQRQCVVAGAETGRCPSSARATRLPGPLGKAPRSGCRPVVQESSTGVLPVSSHHATTAQRAGPRCTSSSPPVPIHVAVGFRALCLTQERPVWSAGSREQCAVHPNEHVPCPRSGLGAQGRAHLQAWDRLGALEMRWSSTIEARQHRSGTSGVLSFRKVPSSGAGVIPLPPPEEARIIAAGANRGYRVAPGGSSRGAAGDAAIARIPGPALRSSATPPEFVLSPGPEAPGSHPGL
jgi:hypothetical protein